MQLKLSSENEWQAIAWTRSEGGPGSQIAWLNFSEFKVFVSINNENDLSFKFELQMESSRSNMPKKSNSCPIGNRTTPENYISAGMLCFAKKNTWAEVTSSFTTEKNDAQSFTEAAYTSVN